MDIQTAHTLLCKIIDKGGLYGSIAKKYLGQGENEHGYILECYEQVHVPGAVSFWGKELVDGIVDYKQRFGGGIDLQKERLKLYKSAQLLKDTENKIVQTDKPTGTSPDNVKL